jgi:uncharacterized protein (TIGR02646 family)
MIPIKKSHHPASFPNEKGKLGSSNAPKVSYKDFSELEKFKGAFLKLREALLSEQKHLCCYCQSYIPSVRKEGTEVNLMQVEHFLPKDGQKYPQFQMDYTNLLAVCRGNSHNKGENHCDAKKGNQELKFLKNPASPEFIDVLDYQVLPKSREVRVKPKSNYVGNKDLERDITEVLNLNEQNLRSRRFSTWENILKKIDLNADNSFKISSKNVSIIEELLDNHDPHTSNKILNEFAGFIHQWLKGRFKDEIQG